MRKRLFALLTFTLFFCFSSFLYSEEINTDVNADGIVNILDLVQVANAFGQPVSDENAAADVNADGVVNILDLVQVAKVYGTDPTGFVVYPYVATHILAQAINNAQSTDASAIKDALLNIKDIETVIGKFAFDQDGSGVYDPTVSIVQDGILQPFPDPVEVETGEPSGEE